MSLTLVDLPSRGDSIERGALREREAARYINLGLVAFRELVRRGVVPARRHPGRMRRIYLKADLNRYLETLPVEREA